MDAVVKPLVARPTGASQRPGYETVAAKIAELISSSGLQPGDRLSTERELGEQLGVSRTVVREAIKVLTTTGLVRARQGSGLYVASEPRPFATAALNFALPVDPEHMVNLFEFRSTLERQSARLAAERITPRELRALEEKVALLWRVLEGNQQGGAGAVELDGEFHRGVAAATHNHFFEETVSSLYRLQHQAIELVLSGAPGSYSASAEQHGAILDAIRQGQAEAAAAAMETHLQTVRKAYQQEVRRVLINSVPAE